MSAGEVRLAIDGPVARIFFDRPAAMNAMTWKMYGEFEEISHRLAAWTDLRAVVLRGVGGRAFVAGSDIAQFAEFDSGADGIAYERKMDRILDAFASIKAPTLAVIDGMAIGGGLNIAGGCDLRVATAGARFGVPIARTLGNCLSMRNYARMSAGLGEAMAKRMLLLGELVTAEELAGTGFLARIVPADEIDETADKLVSRLLAGAPLSMAASKAALGRLARSTLPDIDDLIDSCYGSADFREGIRAFGEKRKPDFTGR
ncbi:enoyl-CoA hydratase [Pseudoponticoccus marisrubri]|uniref:Enoyl-CoA hydratase n=1 Tax=Pseudoponticoccus marisrubri TaxID=1685382 RepID=A0A0W7WMM8_9RHOB|nr:enoyl-CoA hydratase [Pseudoponticoccus marisrubri]KUF11840.1 enoyl-CoA hydratase [Pseudoponticoccus marisrubri]